VVKVFPFVDETRSFITVLTIAGHWMLSVASPVHTFTPYLYRTDLIFPVDVFWIVTPCNVVVGHQLWKRWYPTATLHGVTTQKTST
jgi:hypothetical protein